MTQAKKAMIISTGGPFLIFCSTLSTSPPLDRHGSSFQLANSASPLSVTNSAISFQKTVSAKADALDGKEELEGNADCFLASYFSGFRKRISLSAKFEFVPGF